MFKQICVASVGLGVLAGMALTRDDDRKVASRVAVAVGLTPEAVTVSGLNSADAASLLGRLESATEQVGAFDRATMALDAAINDLLAMDRTLSTTPDDEQIASAREALAQSLPALQTQLNSAKNALIAVGLQGLGSEVRARLEHVMAGASSTLPLELRICPITLVEKRSLEAAITAERRASRMEVPLKAEVTSLLSACRSHADVVAAGACLSSLAAVREVYADRPGQ
ncbi:MAG: hypothetical protein IT436_00060 [Phycisphaerales bacterium]|nr:hypothetical protein [Phycisphaerales bacterium]